jgi:hypothetical protein
MLMRVPHHQAQTISNFVMRVHYASAFGPNLV